MKAKARFLLFSSPAGYLEKSDLLVSGSEWPGAGSLSHSWSRSGLWATGQSAGSGPLGLTSWNQLLLHKRLRRPLGPGDKARHLCVSVTSTSEVPASLTDTIRRNLNDWLVWSEENSTDIMWFWQSKPHWNLAFEYPRGWQQSQGLAWSPIEFTSNQLTAELDKLP